MRIDYCPNCNKAGLKYETPKGEDPDGKNREQRFDEWKEYCNSGKSSEYKSSWGTMKWCPRCKEWVKPQNRPYIGVRGIG